MVRVFYSSQYVGSAYAFETTRKAKWVAASLTSPPSASASSREATEVVNWLLDMDVIRQPSKKNGDAKVIAWLEAEQHRCYTSAGS